jgi:hypothetical protein
MGDCSIPESPTSHIIAREGEDFPSILKRQLPLGIEVHPQTLFTDLVLDSELGVGNTQAMPIQGQSSLWSLRKELCLIIHAINAKGSFNTSSEEDTVSYLQLGSTAWRRCYLWKSLQQ